MGERHHVEDVGRILLHAQRELSQIRATFGHDEENQSAREVQQKLSDVIEKAEANLRLKAEAVLNSSIGHNVATLPSLNEYNFRSSSAGEGPRSLVDASGRTRPPRARSADRRRSLPASTVKDQQNAKIVQRAIDDPTTSLGRSKLAQVFGVPPPRPPKARSLREARPIPGTLAKAKQTKPVRILDHEQLTNPQAPPPNIRPEDVSRGLLSMINRGLLPEHVDLTPALVRAPAPALQAPVRMHAFQEQFNKNLGPAYTSPFGFSAANLKLDLLTGVGESLRARREREAEEHAEAMRAGEVQAAQAKVVDPAEAFQAAADDAQAQAAVDAARGFDELMDTFSLHHFIIRRGEVLDDTPEFVSFQRKYAARWGSVNLVIQQLKELMATYMVPLAYADGKRVADLAMDALSSRTESELLACLVNGEQVQAHMRKPGARYKGSKAVASHAAAAAIQAEWRRARVSKLYARMKRQHAAALFIASYWRFYVDLTATKKVLAERRNERQAAWERMTADFWRDWPRIRKARRVVVHVPSLSHPERQRRTLSFLDVRQNAQMARLCDLKDPNVDVVYVAPFPLNEDTVSYFHKVLEIGGVADPDRRFRIIVPENYARLPAHLSMSSTLLYSPRALRRIKNFCRGKEAYIQPNVVGVEELRLSMALEVPMLAPEPRVAAIYGSKSGSKRIFQAARVNVPPGAHDLYDEDDLIGSLAHLIAHNLDVQRWVFKVDDEFGGRGHASLLTADLPSYQSMLRKYDADPDAWASEGVQSFVQEHISNDLERALPQKVVIASPWLFRTWEEFLAAFSRSGGVIEAAPLEIRSSPSVNLLVEPDGRVTVVSTQEQIMRGFGFVGSSFPQTTVPHPALRDAALAIGRACFAKSIVGHIGVDFVAFVDDQRLLRVWAVDLNLRLTQSACMFGFFHFLAAGEYDADSGFYYAAPAKGTPVPANEEERRAQREADRRCFVMNELFYHPGFTTVHHTAFFNLCRLKGISFDLQNKSGTVFNLLDSFASGVVGVLTAGRSQLDVLKLLTECLDFVQREVGSSADPDPEENGFQEVSLRDVIDGIKTLVDRHKRWTRAAAADAGPKGKHKRKKGKHKAGSRGGVGPAGSADAPEDEDLDHGHSRRDGGGGEAGEGPSASTSKPSAAVGVGDDYG